MKALSARVPFPYVPQADRALPKEQQTEFLLRPLSFLERAYVDDESWQFSGDGTAQLMRGTRRRLALLGGLVGWSNFDGVPFVTEKANVGGVTAERPTEATIERIPLDVQQELAEAILDASKLSDGDRKNS